MTKDIKFVTETTNIQKRRLGEVELTITETGTGEKSIISYRIQAGDNYPSYIHLKEGQFQSLKVLINSLGTQT